MGAPPKAQLPAERLGDLGHRKLLGIHGQMLTQPLQFYKNSEMRLRRLFASVRALVVTRLSKDLACVASEMACSFQETKTKDVFAFRAPDFLFPLFRTSSQRWFSRST